METRRPFNSVPLGALFGRAPSAAHAHIVANGSMTPAMASEAMRAGRNGILVKQHHHAAVGVGGGGCAAGRGGARVCNGARVCRHTRNGCTPAVNSAMPAACGGQRIGKGLQPRTDQQSHVVRRPCQWVAAVVHFRGAACIKKCGGWKNRSQDLAIMRPMRWQLAAPSLRSLALPV